MVTRRPPPAQAGMTYLAVLFAIALLGVSLAATGMRWEQQRQRGRERELLFVGDQFRQAIGAYYNSTPGTVKRYPASFSELLEDRRQLALVRHLRRVYPDPMTGLAKWGIVESADGGIAGVYSLAGGAPLKSAQFRPRDGDFAQQRSYAGWRFVYRPPEPPPRLP